MINDNFSKRVFAVCAGVSMVLLSGSILVWSISKATAETPGSLVAAPKMMPMQSSGGFGIGVTANYIYYGFSADDGTYIYKVDINNPKIKTWE